MIRCYAKETKIYSEFNDDNNKSWFDYKRQKFLHEIDTYYYSITIENDWFNDRNVIAFKRTLSLKNTEYFSSKYVMNGYHFGFYNYDLELPEKYLILIAEHIPNENTPQIIVQLRSYYLWLNGSVHAYEKSLEDIKNNILTKFGLKIKEVKVNRIDYAFHTNYIQAPSKVFDLKHLKEGCVTRYKEGDMHFEFKHDEIELDYLRLGRLKSNNTFLRIYNKTKEVVQMNYKNWFLKVWLIHGLINRYDLYVLEKCYERHNWNYLNKARLEFYLEHGNDTKMKHYISSILDEVTKADNEMLQKLADKLTPKVTIILNIEFQTKTKFYSSLKLMNFRNRQGYDRDLRMIQDNRKLILEYLTHDTVRFVDERSSITRKSNKPYSPFWKRLRGTRLVDTVVPNKHVQMIRNYSSQKNAEVVKKRALNNIALYSVYQQFSSGNSTVDDIVDFVADLNDNDMYRLKKYKVRKLESTNTMLTQSYKDKRLALYDRSTGELLN